MEKIIYRGIIFIKPDFEDQNNNRTRTNKAILCGRLKHNPCEICGHEIAVAHHEKYADFLNIRWLCYSDHKIIHWIFNHIESAEDNLIIAENKFRENPDSELFKINYEFAKRKLDELLEKYELKIIK